MGSFCSAPDRPLLFEVPEDLAYRQPPRRRRDGQQDEELANGRDDDGDGRVTRISITPPTAKMALHRHRPGFWSGGHLAWPCGYAHLPD